MPELPEVETVKRTLEKKLVGLAFEGIHLHMPKIVRLPQAQEFVSSLTGRKILRLGRRGKYLMLHLSGNYTLVIHLRMTGRLVYANPDTPMEKHTHVVFLLSNGDQLRYTDIRQFGRMLLAPTPELDTLPGLRDLGVEPLGEHFTREFMKKELKRRRTRLKALLLDQSFIAGLGNIYVDESLHRAGLHPERLAMDLTPRETTRLFQAIKEVLTDAVNNRGTSFRDYVDGEGRPGNNKERLQVYSREGLPCHKCGKPIHRIRVAGRSSFFCPQCQKV
ncbi:bifunctional DNA-formamidopyrimidine glycosylase/DNA-(apurinic or apyrimidinic site) lyase [Desulfocucumis palustris]|nr:bifunctional DNA-formamidopyrimidine glycosylase/DNA-(apurinic or apyrimidinic site) lyase [Desulfocucumis palustris]